MALPPEPWRPVLHFTPQQGWMNDPNGLVVHGGHYHLFFQYHPHGTQWGPMHWGHAVSRDLLRWEELPIALKPDAHGAIFSGCIVEDADNRSGLVPGGGLVAVFSYDNQSQGLAGSTDGGRTWSMCDANPVLAALHHDFRDPKVFRYGDGWSMVIAAGDHLEFFRSPDLREWSMTGRFDVALDVGVWECPDLFPLDWHGTEVWVLLLSIGWGAPSGGSATMWFTGAFDGSSFTADGPPTWLDRGPDCYAGVTWNDADTGDRILIAWMSNWVYARELPTQRWRGAMTIPRRLSLTGGERPVLIQQPQGVEGRRRDARGTWDDPIPPVAEVALTLTCADQRDPRVLPGLRLSWGPAGRVDLVWDRAAATLTLDRSDGGQVHFHPDFAGLYGAPVRRVDVLDLRIIVDRCSVEVFADGGRTVLTALVFPVGDGTSAPPFTVTPLEPGDFAAFAAWSLVPSPG